MIKRNLLLFCGLCLTAGFLWIYFSEQFVKPVLQKYIPVQSQPVSSTPTMISPKPVAKVITMPITPASNNVVMSEVILTNVPGEDVNEKDQIEKYRLLRELRAWAAKDADAALAAAMKLPAGDNRNEALAAVCFGLAEIDPAAAVKTAKSLHLDDQPGAVLENLIQQWATSDTSSALDWANSQPAGTQRDGLTMRIAYVMSQSDPSAAANLVLSQIMPGSTQDEAIMTVLNQWANQNLTAAANWSKALSTGPLQERALNELVGIQNRQQALAHQ